MFTIKRKINFFELFDKITIIILLTIATFLSFGKLFSIKFATIGKKIKD